MDLRRLKYFVVLSEELSFSHASSRLYISQSAMSHHIHRLEVECGSVLFDRSTRRVSLTAAGQRLLPIARDMLRLEAQAYEAVRDVGDRIRVAANMSFSSQALSAIAKVSDDFPGAEIEFMIKSFSQRIEAVLAHESDVALIRGDVARPGLDVVPLWKENLIIALNKRHPLAEEPTLRLSDLAGYPLILPRRSDQVFIHDVVGASFVELGVRPNFGEPIDVDRAAPLELLRQPKAWTVLYPISATHSDQLVYKEESDRRLRIPVSAIVRQGTADNALISALLEALKSAGASRDTD